MAVIIKINRRWQQLQRDTELPCEHTALLLCDVWDKHWTRGASERVDEMAPRMNEVTHGLGDRGVAIVHALRYPRFLC